MPDWMINYWPFLGILVILGVFFLIKGTGAFGLEKDDNFVIAGGVLTGVGVLGVYPAIHELYDGAATRKYFEGIKEGTSNRPLNASDNGGVSRKSRKSRKNRKTVA